jgi:hypothetical protein
MKGSILIQFSDGVLAASDNVIQSLVSLWNRVFGF